MKALKAIVSSVVFGAFFFSCSISAFAEMSMTDLLNYGFTNIESTTDLVDTTKNLILLSKESGLIFDKDKFESQGGEFRGGGAGRYSTRYDIPAGSLVQNPYYEYFEAPKQEYQNAPTPVVDAKGYIVQYVYPSYMGLLTKRYNQQLQDDLNSSGLVYPFSESYYYFGTSWPWAITAVNVNNIATMTIWDVPMAGTYYLLYPKSYRGGMYGSIVRSSGRLKFGGDDGSAAFRIYDSTGTAITDNETSGSFNANVGHKFACIRTFDVSPTTYYANDFVSLECLAQPLILGILPSMPQYRPSQIPTFNGFDVQFNADLNVDLFSPIVINVDTPDIAFDFSVNIDNSTYPAYYYTIDESQDTTIYYYDNSGQVSGSITYNEVTNMYTVYNYANGAWMEGSGTPGTAPTPGPSSSPAPTSQPVPTPTLAPTPIPTPVPTTNPMFPGYDDDLQNADSALDQYDEQLFEDVNHYKDQLTFNLDEWGEYSSGLDYVRMVFMKIWDNIPTQIIVLSLMLGVGALIIGRGVKMANSKKDDDNV